MSAFDHGLIDTKIHAGGGKTRRKVCTYANLCLETRKPEGTGSPVPSRAQQLFRRPAPPVPPEREFERDRGLRRPRLGGQPARMRPPPGETLSCRSPRRTLEGGIVANRQQGLPAASRRDWWSPGQRAGPRDIRMGEAGQRREWNGRGRHGAAEATRDGGGDLRYASPAWAGRRSLEPGGVMRQSLVRGPRGVGERPKWRGGGEGKVGVPSWSGPFAVSCCFRAGQWTVLRAGSDTRALFEPSALFLCELQSLCRMGTVTPSREMT